jgi:SAM-dependent methyltransferase
MIPSGLYKELPVSLTSSFPVHPGNLAQLRAWDGEEGGYWAAHADVFHRALAGYDDALFAAAAIGATERVLDIGCGTGQMTRAAGRRAHAGRAVGVDLSSAMLHVARRVTEQEALEHVTFVQADAQVHAFPQGSFDVAISRTGAMFFADPVEAFGTVARALRPRGRLVLLVWQSAARNEWFGELSGALAAGRALPVPPPDAPHPFSLAEPERTRGILSAAGLAGVGLTGIEQPMWFGPDVPAAHDFVLGLLGWQLATLDPAVRDHALARLRRTLEAHTGPDGVQFGSACWLVTARRPG